MNFSISKNKKKIAIIFIIVLLGLILLCVIIFNNKKDVTKKDGPSLEEITTVINQTYKKGALLDFENNETSILDSSSKSLLAWEEMYKVFGSEQPEKYKKTDDWHEKVQLILEHEKRANKFLKNGEEEQAKGELAQSREIFGKIKEENNINSISTEMLDVYKDILVVANAQNKQEAEPSLQKLKYKFTVLKEHNFDDNSSKLLLDMEKTIGQLDRSADGPEFKKAQADLKIIFEKIYMEY